MATKVRRQTGEDPSLGNSSSTTNNILQPKFYKIMVRQHECTRLRIPEGFAGRYCKNMLNPVYLEVPSGEVWEVEVEHCEGQIWLVKGWQDFCDYYSISCGNFLMFGYNAHSHFNVTIFDLSAAEIEYPYSSSAHGIRTFHCHETHHAPNSDQSESDDSVDILEAIPRNQKLNEKIPDMVEHAVENPGHFPLGQSSKRKRHKGDAEDDVSVDMHIKRMEVEKSVEDVASPSLTSMGQKSNEDCGMHKQQSKSVSDQNKTVMDKESAITYQKAKAFKSKNPFIISFMQPSYVFTPFNLSIPLNFARKYFLENNANLVLRVPRSGSWSVKCTFGTGNAKVHSGWKAFVLENKLKVGDVCVFEVIKGAQLLVDVTIFRASGSTLRHNVVGEVPGVSDSKSKGIKTDNSVPCSQPKVVHTEKLKQRIGGSYGISSKIKEEHGEGTEIEHSAEILGHYSLGESSKRKRLEGDAEDDVSIDIHTKSIKVEKSQQDAASPSCTRKNKKSGGSCRMHKQQPKIVYDNNKTVMDKERAIAYRRAKAFKSRNPFLISFIQPSYITIPYILNISSAFARKYLLKNGRDVVLCVPGRGSWSVRCTSGTANSKIHSGWKAFALDNKLKSGDVCVFEVIEGTQLFIDVTIFRADGSIPMHKIAGEKPGVSDGKNNVTKTDYSLPCSQPKVVHTNKSKQQRGGSYGISSRIKEEHGEGTEIEHSVEILSHCPLRHGSTRKRLEGEAEDDDSIDTRTKSIKVEKSQADVPSPSFTRKAERSRESCRMHKQQTEMVYAKNMTVLDKERAIAYQRAKAFTSKNPFVIYFMQPSYVSKPYNLRICFLFAWKYFREKCGDLVLRVPGRGSWSVKYDLGISQASIRFTWKAFVLDNKLQIGDVCVFELIEATQPFLDVTIFRAAESKPMHKIDGGVSDCMSKMIKTENSVPHSQPNIVHSRKLNLEKKQKEDSNGFITSKIKEELGKGTVKHVQQSKSSCMGRVVAKEMVMAYQKAKAFTSKNPFFISFMQPSYVSPVSSQMQLTITLSVARNFFPTSSDVVLRVSSKREWNVKCSLGTSNAKFSAGWKKFVLDNNLKVGDVCVFEQASRSKLLFNVIIFSCAEGLVKTCLLRLLPPISFAKQTAVMVNKFRRQIDEGSSIGNSSSNILQPKFCKIIFGPHECCRLRIPQGFASSYCKNMLNPVYLEVPTGEVWEVEVEHCEGQIWLAEGWKDFSNYYSISRGHFLMFGYNARSHFNVIIFDLSAAEIEYPIAETESDDSTDISDVVRHSAEYLSHGSLVRERKRKRQEGEAEDDIPVYLQTNVIEEEESQGYVVSVEISEGCEEHEQQSNTVTSKSEAERDKERAENYQRAKAFKSENPFVICFMHASYISRPHSLSIPLKFARKYFRQNSGNLELRVPGRGSWPVKCIFLRKEAKVTSGWKAFVLDNKLKSGDVCVFEVIKDTKLSLINVTIYPGDSGSTNESINVEASVPVLKT
ncbi:hypothetical protein HAX54_013268 [Datura stramonium]|uniref:TF-B3 domain-containing protein n=1 Tax=Datura stramonium TaxID=4076 RepID=A0ABS8TL17_DATST|nr:hypothetical protein [Datura stramonium]